MPGRNYSAGSEYRYGFNGQEKSGEIGGGFTTATYWEYDSRIGRRWNVDPIYKHSPYEVLGGNPMLYNDINGADTVKITKTTTSTKVKGSNDGHSDALTIPDKRINSTDIDIKIDPADGDDVFIYTANHVEIDEQNNSTVTLGTIITLDIRTGIFGGTHGITKGKAIYFDGLITGIRDNTDRESLSKFMDLDPNFNSYMLGRGYCEMYNQSSSMEVMEALMPPLVQGMTANYVGWRYATPFRSQLTEMPLYAKQQPVGFLRWAKGKFENGPTISNAQADEILLEARSKGLTIGSPEFSKEYGFHVNIQKISGEAKTNVHLPVSENYSLPPGMTDTRLPLK